MKHVKITRKGSHHIHSNHHHFSHVQTKNVVTDLLHIKEQTYIAITDYYSLYSKQKTDCNQVIR